MTQHDPLHDHDQQQAAQERGEPLTLDTLTVLLDWLTDEISALENDDLNMGGQLLLTWLKAKRRELNARLLAPSDNGEVLP